jgi:uncharacterized protein (DUF58 family)
MTKSSSPLLSAEFLARLEQLELVARRMLMGRFKGDRLSKRKGTSVEFADHRHYVVGDDFRFLDWNLYARLDKLFLRLFMEEEDLSLSILFDVTRSMDFGEPAKLDYEKRLAAALGYIGLVNYNRVHLFAFADGIVGHLPSLRGRRPIPQMLDFLSMQTASERPGNLAAATKRFALTQTQKGIVVLVSDFFDKGDLTTAVRYLAGDRYDVYVIQLLAPQEINPEKAGVVGDVRLSDIEDGDEAEVSISPALLKRYKANLQAYCNHVRDLCVRRDIAYLFSDTSVPFDTLVLKYLRERGLLG